LGEAITEDDDDDYDDDDDFTVNLSLFKLARLHGFIYFTHLR